MIDTVGSSKIQICTAKMSSKMRKDAIGGSKWLVYAVRV